MICRGTIGRANRAIFSFGRPASINFRPVTLSAAAKAIWRERRGREGGREGRREGGKEEGGVSEGGREGGRGDLGGENGQDKALDTGQLQHGHQLHVG